MAPPLSEGAVQSIKIPDPLFVVVGAAGVSGGSAYKKVRVSDGAE
jgi:hypothetical protein